MNFKLSPIPYLTIACLIGAVTLFPNVVQAQDARVKTAMELLESKANKLGPAKIDGTDTVAGKQVPAIYFGSTKMNNNFDLVTFRTWRNVRLESVMRIIADIRLRRGAG